MDTNQVMDAKTNGALPYLEALVAALDNAFISSWQTTAGWQKELDAARDYLAALAPESAP